MPVTSEKPAPYAPHSSIVELIERYRNRGLPSPVTADVLLRAGISQSLVSRTLYALQVLDLIDEQGAPTKTFEGLRLAPEAEYKQRLSQWLQSAYADVLKFVDPADDDETKIRDAFRSYQPVGQQARMITLFLGLLAAAGMVAEKRGSQPRRPSSPPQKSQRASNGTSQTSKPSPENKKETVTASPTPHQQTSHDDSYEKLLLEKFPAFDPSWTEDLKKAWFEGFKQFQEMARKDRA
ncbi:hypothetical protein Rvan_1638 [Rhodomicrobium vannielii ATCC 17100]|uniref:Uncharacterized protein n=1 Tax=Rhodomicrobium vannielii (strain ATCC 17100 / DSM 162 / LMG 4299 / NCIMB 10020 / ATH 3.1.1) TaxID=648757 RepID=E3I8H9_RHOVT|nr:DUF5343 domain-containing protein [Rhodomicrobium vannielii]ADP70888.1 hypothetical protein Rvan_1638 [Rhodomicrobium vannielii ATCC 17100]